MVKNTPLVSVVVTTYNRKKYLHEAISSILNQTFKNFELIVVDNHSDYDIGSFILSFKDNRITLLKNNNNGMYVINRNLGIKVARGKYIAFCDDDDIWVPEKLQLSLDIFAKDNSLGMVTSKEGIINEVSKKCLKTTQSIINESQYFSFKDFFLYNAGSPSGAVIKMKCFKEIGYFDESNEIKGVEDYHFWLKLAARYNVYYQNKVLGYSRVHVEQEGNISEMNLINLHNLFIDIWADYYILIKPFKKEAIKRIKSVQLRFTIYYLKRKLIIKSLKWFLIYLMPFNVNNPGLIQIISK